MDLKIHMDDFGLSEQLEVLSKSLHPAIEGSLQRATRLLRDAVETNIRSPFGFKPPAVAFGILASSVRQAVYDAEGAQVGQVFLAPPADRYGLFVELGTRPHWPPIGALIPWVQVQFRLTNPRAIRRAAWAVAVAISKRGTAGHFMFWRALQENKEKVLDLLEKGIDRVIPGRA